MEPFKSFRGLIATLDRANIDTDQIIPKQFLKSIKRTGYGENLFFDWRYLPDGKPDPKFPLNEPRFKDATILVVRNNFGCGSSREHAVWAIAQYGFKAVIAPWVERGGTRIPGFADIFKNNCVKNSLLTIELSEAEVEEIFQMVARYSGLQATINLDEQRVTLHTAEEISFHFEVDPAVKERLVHGLDDIGLTLKHEEKIATFETRHNSQISL
ncbi:MAG: 3-isopropylmalate dehydratase small subunit [Candidatus Omnitrophica bacterium]|nr:3-isopropylmalate dehydratase small subunit [Candidatus Omnitrophota bacterium]